MLTTKFSPLVIAYAFVLLLASSHAQSAAAQKEYATAPTPTWVTPVAVSVSARAPKEASGGVYYLLLDDQVRVSASGPESYSRFVLRVLNKEGLDEAAQFSVDFDPAYQELTLHEVSVIRDGKRRNALKAENITVLQREKELERKIYDGRKTANVIIDDVRVDDFVEYSYSVRGANPIFDGRFSEHFYTRYSSPVHHIQYRLLWPSSRTLHAAGHGDAPQPEIFERGAIREYRWELTEVPALLSDGEVPSWFDPWPWVQLSEWASWSAVAAWAEPLYESKSADVRDLADEISRAAESPEEQLLAALRFAQDEIRYLGFEMGRGSHEPRTPAVVLKNRFGDCKDKTRLLVSVLKELGIEAHPAFVNSNGGRMLSSWHPSPLAFDHVIVVAHFDGKKYWLDPTLDHQRGTLDRMFQPDYGEALVVRKGATSLETMGPPPLREPNREIEVTLNLKDGLDKPARYTVRTIYHGSGADAMRATLAGQSSAELLKQYLNYYASTYPTIESSGSLDVYDDQDLNRLIVDEHYMIPDIWERSDDEPKSSITLYPSETADLIRKPSTSIRSMPLAVSHPYHQVHTITVMLPERWNVEDEKMNISNRALEFDYEASYANEVITIRYEYKTKADHVLPEHAAEHLKNIDRISETLGYEIYRWDDGAEASAGVNWQFLLISLLSLAVAAHLAVKAYRYDPPRPPLTAEERDPRYSGIGGWLILVSIGIVTNPFRILGGWVQVLDAAAPATWNAVTNPASSAYHPLWAPTLTFEMIGNCMLFVFAVLVVVLFFQKRQSFPRVFTIFMIASASISVIDTALTLAVPATGVQSGQIFNCIRDVITSGIWITYMQMSKRVESTFVRRRTELAGEITAVPAAA